MDKRLRKQIIIALVFFGIFSFIGGGIFLTYRSDPSCFDNKRNQGEEDIDCGGPCILCELKYNPPLSLADAPVLLINQNNEVDILFKITNSNLDWGAQGFSYKVILIGEDQEKQEFVKLGFIFPHEIRYFIVPNIAVAFKPVKADIEILKETIVWNKPLIGIDLNLGDPFIVTNVKMITPEPIPGVDYNVYTFTKTLVLGMTDAEVFNLQKVLSLDPAIYPEGEVTGYFGKMTEAAVKRFQSKYGIRTTGQVGPQTRAKLHELHGPSDMGPFSYIFTLTLKKEDRGDEVLNLQRALMLDSTTSPLGSITGYFGEITEKAVKDFQSKYEIKATGQVGPLTRDKLNELFGKPSEAITGLPGEQLESFEATLEVKGDVYNSTSYNWRNGNIAVILCDDNRKPVSVGTTVLEDIYSGKSSQFVIQWQQKLPDNISVCEKITNINILNEENVFLSP